MSEDTKQSAGYRAAVRQAPGWWPSLCRVECDLCGYRGPVVDLNAKANAALRLRFAAEGHVCGQEDE